MLNVKAKTGKATAYALIRDKNGKPKIDDIENCPKEILDALTKDEIEELKNGINTRNSNS